MKNLFFIVTILIATNISFAQESAIQTHHLKINKNIDVEVERSTEYIKTNNILPGNKSHFQVEYYFDDGVLYYIRFANPDLGIDKTFSVKRVTINGYGYRQKKTDENLDFFFPRQRTENESKMMDAFSNNPDFKNNDQLIAYFETLYRNISEQFAEKVGTVAIFGHVIANKMHDFLYFRFDNEKFSTKQKVKIEGNYVDFYSKKYEGSYHIDFDRKQLADRQTIYFSIALVSNKDTVLVRQNSLNLTEIRKQMTIAITEPETIVYNDIFLDQNFDRLIKPKKDTPQDEKKYIGKYTTKSRTDQDIVFELRDGNVYYSKDGDLEDIGLWKIGQLNFMKNPAINIYNIHTKNRKTGVRTKPADVGSSIDILIDKEKLLYPISLPEVWHEIKKVAE